MQRQVPFFFLYLHRTEKSNHWIPVSLSAQQHLMRVHEDPHSQSWEQKVTVEKQLKEYV